MRRLTWCCPELCGDWLDVVWDHAEIDSVLSCNAQKLTHALLNSAETDSTLVLDSAEIDLAQLCNMHNLSCALQIDLALSRPVRKLTRRGPGQCRDWTLAMSWAVWRLTRHCPVQCWYWFNALLDTAMTNLALSWTMRRLTHWSSGQSGDWLLCWAVGRTYARFFLLAFSVGC